MGSGRARSRRAMGVCAPVIISHYNTHLRGCVRVYAAVIRSLDYNTTPLQYYNTTTLQHYNTHLSHALHIMLDRTVYYLPCTIYYLRFAISHLRLVRTDTLDHICHAEGCSPCELAVHGRSRVDEGQRVEARIHTRSIAHDLRGRGAFCLRVLL